MARSRNIKPDFYLNEYLGVCDPLEQLLFAGLWLLADRKGRLEYRPLKIKAQIFPYREINAQVITGFIRNLSSNGFLTCYNVDGADYIQIDNFVKHQKPHKNEKPSVLPEPPAKSISCKCSSNYASDPDKIGTARADSLSSDSLSSDSLIPENPTPEFCRAATPLGVELTLDDAAAPTQQSAQTPNDKLIKKKPATKIAKPNGDATAQIVAAVIRRLNEKTGCKFTTAESNAKLIRARIAEGATEEQMCAVVDSMVSRWRDDAKMRQYLRPATLFNAEKFSQYLGQIGMRTEIDEWAEFLGVADDAPTIRDVEGEVLRHD